MADTELGGSDLGPLAWVADELRKSLDNAIKALKRFSREAEALRGSDLAAIDTSQLRIARSQVHQALGAMEMVGLESTAVLLRSIESAVQAFVTKPQLCTDKAAQTLETAAFAVMEFIDASMAGRQSSAVQLFNQYKDVQALSGNTQAHPADLWGYKWRWMDVSQVLPATPGMSYEAATRSRLDQAVLSLMRGQMDGARTLTEVTLGLASHEERPQVKTYWQLVAAFGQALVQGLKQDIYVKRVLPTLVSQYVALMTGVPPTLEKSARDLLFFCAQTSLDAAQAQQFPVLHAIRQAYRLSAHVPVEYDKSVFGTFDPAILAQARKRLASAKDAWGIYTSGDKQKARTAADQMGLVADSLAKLHPASHNLVRVLKAIVQPLPQQTDLPQPELSMEVATTLLYLEAMLENFDPADPELASRTEELASRMEIVQSGSASPPLMPWMEELYHRFSERGTLGSVVGELRNSLAELEKALDQFFRGPEDTSALVDVPSRLVQMRGVLSVLGVDHATAAVGQLREWIDSILSGQVSAEQGSGAGGLHEKIGNSLGALGFLIDMLAYQPNLARKLFVFNPESGELSPIMGRHAEVVEAQANVALDADVGSPVDTDFVLIDDSPAQAGSIAQEPAPVALPVVVPAAAAAPAPVLALPVEDGGDFEEDDLLDIFLEEARDVMVQAKQSLAALSSNPADMEVRTTLRRAFHTLKGSSRMVGLSVFGEAAWAMEQAHNASLADPGPMSSDLLQLSSQALDGMDRWIARIAAKDGGADQMTAAPYVLSADALRTEGKFIALNLSASEPVVEVVEAVSEPEPAAPMELDINFDLGATPVSLDATQMLPRHTPAQAEPPPAFESGATEIMPDLDALLAVPAVQTPPQESPEPAPAVEQPAELVFDLSSIDLDLPDAEHEVIEALAMPEKEFEPVIAQAISLDQPVLEPQPVAEPELTYQPIPEPEPEPIVDENLKVVGDLRINLTLYNVFLSEADEWSRMLQSEISEVALAPGRMPSESCIAWAHSLAGSSATVGYEALSQISREFENSLNSALLHGHLAAGQAEVYVAVADEIRRMLHQFAAGFAAQVQPDLIEQLRQDWYSASDVLIEDSGFDLDLSDAEVVVVPELPVLVDPEPELVQPDAPVDDDVRPELLQVAAPVPTAPVQALHDDDDEIDAIDAIDPDLFPIFEEEALELIPNLGAALRQWTMRPDNHGARTEALRLMHTIKGSARLAGALRLGEMIHHMESEVERMGSDVQAAGIEPLVAQFDRASNVFDALRARDAKAYQAAMDDATYSAEHEQAVPVVSNAASAQVAPLVAGPAPEAVTGRAVQVHTPAALVVKQSNQSVRVKSNLLDRLVNQAGEVMMTRSKLEAEVVNLRGSLSDLTANLDKLRLQLRDIELQAESQMQSRMAQSKEAQANFDPLEFDRFTRVQELTRMMAESVNDVATVQRNLQRSLQETEDSLVAQARQTRELQRDLLRTRMVEFEGISERLYRVVRLASKETGKQVRLDITGGNIEMDRGMLDRMTPSFEHLLRNCVAHGIEDMARRQAAGKDPAGLITVSLSQEGNDVTLEFRDDGAGLNIPRIRDKAESLGLIQPGASITDKQAGDLIFMPGFSTASEVTELAGRGIGMDVVRAEVYSLGGRIDTTTTAGQGTSFKLVLPLTTAVTQIVLVRAGQLLVGVPATMIEIVRRASARELELGYNAGQYDVGGGESAPFFWAGALLQSSARSTEPVGRSTPVVIFRSAAQRVAVHVDEVLGNQEVVVKNLGAQLSRLPGLAGMTMLPSGAVVLIYNPVALATVYGEQARKLGADLAEPHVLGDQLVRVVPDAKSVVPVASQAPAIPLVMVVDDSITVRKVTQRLLSREGYRVVLAADGLQALERLQEELPSIVLSDIEMPRMDGFDLARNIRGDARMKHLPIVMITSRIAEKHREHAASLGVNHYLGKPYSEEELLSLVKRYCTQEATV